MALSPIPLDLIFKKDTPDDVRLGNFTEPAKLETIATSSPSNTLTCLGLMGAPDDQGIQLSGGRLGAQHGPREIRRAFYKMTPHVKAQTRGRIFDFGDLERLPELAQRHAVIADHFLQLHNKARLATLLGGGHDYGFPAAQAFLNWCKINRSELKPLVINMDAHLDVRPTDHGLSSGTPFRRLLENTTREDFDFLEMGLQPQCNSQTHWRWAEAWGAVLLDQEETSFHLQQIQAGQIPDFLNLSSSRRPLHLSIDIDVLNQAEAPGCSQSFTSGLSTREILAWIRWLSKHFELKSLGIYEVSPPLDLDNRTSKTAAILLHQAWHCVQTEGTQ
jgi:formiminoglutamase